MKGRRFARSLRPKPCRNPPSTKAEDEGEGESDYDSLALGQEEGPRTDVVCGVDTVPESTRREGGHRTFESGFLALLC